MMVKTLII